MKILIACECSGTVRDAMLARGHEALSCDLPPVENPRRGTIRADMPHAAMFMVLCGMVLVGGLAL